MAQILDYCNFWGELGSEKIKIVDGKPSGMNISKEKNQSFN